jgi:nitroreductase
MADKENVSFIPMAHTIPVCRFHNEMKRRITLTIQEAIYKRKSSRSFDTAMLKSDILEEITIYAKSLKPLYPDIQTEFQIAGKEKVKSILPWKGPHNVVIFSEDKAGCYENVGFMYQQLDLYMQSIGLACCWIGMGKLAKGDNEEIALKPFDPNMLFVIYITIGYPRKGLPIRTKRKALADIADKVDERLEPARLAPSGKNMQPWYFAHNGDVIDTYCTRLADNKPQKDKNINRIDIGCALAHLYVANPDTFRFFIQENPPVRDGYIYIGSFYI